MARLMVLTAVLTGLFCVVFAVTVNWVAERLGVAPLLVLSFISGFLGSLVAQSVLRPWWARVLDARRG